MSEEQKSSTPPDTKSKDKNEALSRDRDRDTDSIELSNGPLKDPWKEMGDEAYAKDLEEREQKRRAKQNELLGIDNEQQMDWDESGLVVPIKNLVRFAGRGRVLCTKIYGALF